MLKEGERLVACGGDNAILRETSTYDSSLICAVSKAFFGHFPLVLRPDDLMFALLSQLALMRNLGGARRARGQAAAESGAFEGAAGMADGLSAV